MSNDKVKIDLPITAIEPLFTVLHNIKATQHSRLEMKAVSLLKQTLVFELERMMETPEEKEQRELNFKELFHKERLKRLQAYTDRERAF